MPKNRKWNVKESQSLTIVHEEKGCTNDGYVSVCHQRGFGDAET